MLAPKFLRSKCSATDIKVSKVDKVCNTEAQCKILTLAFSRMAVVDSTLGLTRFLLQQAFVVISDHVAPTHFVLSLWTFGDATTIDRVPGGVDAFPVLKKKFRFLLNIFTEKYIVKRFIQALTDYRFDGRLKRIFRLIFKLSLNFF